MQCVAAVKKACFRRVRLFMGADVVSTMSPCPPAVHPHTQNGGALGTPCITTVMGCESFRTPHSSNMVRPSWLFRVSHIERVYCTRQGHTQPPWYTSTIHTFDQHTQVCAQNTHCTYSLRCLQPLLLSPCLCSSAPSSVASPPSSDHLWKGTGQEGSFV